MNPGTLVRLRCPIMARDKRKLATKDWLLVEQEPLRVRAIWGAHVDLERPLNLRRQLTEHELLVMNVPVDALTLVEP